EDTGADRLVVLVDENSGVTVKANHRAVSPTDVLRGANDDRAVHVALLHAAARSGLLHRDDDDIAHACVFTLGAAQHLDAHHALGTRVIGDVQVSLHLNHSTTSCLGRQSGDFFENAPRLLLRNRTAFLDAHDVARLDGVFFIMRVILFRPTHDLAVQRVTHAALHQHDHRLVGLVGHNRALKDTLRHVLTP